MCLFMLFHIIPIHTPRGSSLWIKPDSLSTFRSTSFTVDLTSFTVIVNENVYVIMNIVNHPIILGFL